MSPMQKFFKKPIKDAFPRIWSFPSWQVLFSWGLISLVLFLCILGETPAESAVNQQDATPDTIAWYQQETVPEAGKAYVEIMPQDNPTKTIRNADFPDGLGWFYTFFLREKHGIAFTINEVVMDEFDGNGVRYSAVYDSGILLNI